MSQVPEPEVNPRTPIGPARRGRPKARQGSDAREPPMGGRRMSLVLEPAINPRTPIGPAKRVSPQTRNAGHRAQSADPDQAPQARESPNRSLGAAPRRMEGTPLEIYLHIHII